VAEAVEVTGFRVARSADSANDRVGRLRVQAGNQIGRVGDRWGRRSARLGLGAFFANARAAVRGRSEPAAARLQLANTSRELAHETADLGVAVASLNAVIKSNRKAAAKTRTRLFFGIVIGAALAYHLDSEHGGKRRAASAQLVANAARSGMTKARAVADARGPGGTRPA
jgi:hypothetical protein